MILIQSTHETNRWRKEDIPEYKGFKTIKPSQISSAGADVILVSTVNPGKIKQFIVDNNYAADCYILDLRLHEEDHTSQNYKQYSGHQIARYIYDRNHGSQIVIFTASEKVVNYTESEQFVSDYVMKENPRDLLSREDSKNKFNELANAIQKAFNKSYLREYYELCKDRDYLNDFFEILRLDDKKKLSTHHLYMRSAVLNLMVYIEAQTTNRFKIAGTSLYKDSEQVGDVKNIFLQSYIDNRTNRRTASKMTSESDLCDQEAGRKWDSISKIADRNKNKDEKEKENIAVIFLICAVLSVYYHIDDSNINKVIELKNYRNKTVAHPGNPHDIIELETLRDVFDKIVKPMVYWDEQSK